MNDASQLDELKEEIKTLEDENPHQYRELREFVCGLSYTDASPKAYTRLDNLEKGNIEPYSTSRLEFVIRSLNEADELNGCIAWQTGLWDNCSIEELLGGLIEAENLLESHEGDREIEESDE